MATDPFAYADRFNPRRQEQSTQPTADPVAAEIERMRQQEIRTTLDLMPEPDRAAKVTRVARDAGVPPVLVEDTLEDAERAQRVRQFTSLADRYPAIGRFALQNPRAAAAAQDDSESLGVLGSAWDFVSKLPARLGGAGGWRLGEMLADTWNTIEEFEEGLLSPVDVAMGTLAEASGIDLLDPRALREAAAETREQRSSYFRENAARVREANRGSNRIVEGLLQGTESIPATAIAIATRNPNAAATTLGVMSGSSEFAEARRQGLGVAPAFRYGVTQGAIEAITERIPVGTLTDLIARKVPWGKAFVRELGQEMTGEQIATFLQDMNSWASLPSNAGKTFADFLRERPGAAVDTALGVVSGSTITTAGIGAAQRATDAAVAINERVQSARVARAERQFFDKAEKAVEGSKLRQRDPEAFRELLRQQAEEAGTREVYIPGEAVREFQQSDAYDQDNDPFQQWNPDEAVASGGDLVVPIEDVLTDLVGTPAWQAIKDDVRLTPGGMSAREAQTFEESMDDVLAEMSEAAAKQAETDRAAMTVREQLIEQVATQFGTSFTAPVARQIAELAVTRAETRARRLGQDLIGEEFGGFEVRQVMPEGVREAVKADQLDLVINAMRKGGEVEQGVGPSLLEFIRQRGGINDTGGDLRSMGLPANVLREFDPRQGAFGGVSGEGDFGVDTTLRAAIEAGYFPELVGVEQEAGASTLDTQVLLDALADEIAGRSRFVETREDPMRAAAEDLRAMLQESGLNPDEMTDAEIRQAVEGMSGLAAESGRILLQSDGFRRWFGDSKVVDESGNPLVVYHGTTGNITQFDESRRGENTQAESAGMGFFFTDDARTAESYANYAATDARVAALLREADQAEQRGDWDAYDAKVAEYEALDLSFAEPDNRLAGQNVMPVYLSIQNPLRVNANGENAVGFDIPAAIRQAVQGGHDGLIIENLDDAAGLSDREATHYVIFEPTQVKSINNRGTFDPSDPRILYQSDMSDNARGRIVFDSNRRIIELFQSRNLSTPLHELSHMWLEELRFDAETMQSPEVFADWETVKAWFKKNGHAIGKDGQIPTEAHELFARAGERYLMEGKAPSTALARLFETFRSWLVTIYKTVDRLRAPITPEIREVFDRLLATDEEIAAARERQGLEALFKDAAEVGMSDAEFRAYQDQVENARAGAHASLLDKTMRAVRRRETERYRETRKLVRAEEQERIDASPLYRAISLMREQRVSREWIADEMGLDALDLLPVRVPPLYVAGGAHPDVIAEQAGYSSGRDMIEALIGAERAHRQAKEGGDKRSMRERAIETATDEEMLRRYGDPLNDGSIEREALAAVHSEMQGEVIASEIRVLARRTGQRPTPYRLAREWARGKIRSGIVAEEASPGALQRYARNAAKAGRAAEQAMLEQNVDEAFRQKQFQMLNNALLAEAKQAADEVEAAVKRMDKIASARTRKSIDQDYLEQAQALLEAVDLRKRSQVGIDRQGKWEAWAAARQAEGFDVVVPGSFEATIGQTNWSRLSVENLLALDEAVKQIIHLGRLKQTLLDNQEEREWEEIYREAEDGGDIIGRKPPEGSFTEPGWWDSVKHRVLTADAALLKMETVFDWLDNSNSNGVFNRIAFRPIAEAQAREQEMLSDYYGRIREAMERVPAETVRRWGDKVTLDLIDPETNLPAVMTRQKLVAMALNWGNAGNRQRLADGYGWSPQGIEAALMEHLTEPEWRFVQETWDIIDTLWPDIEKMERSINGVAPEKVEATEVVTPYGTFRGGYYPAIYDTTLDYTAEEQAGRQSDLFEAKYVRATTRASATKDRMNKVSRPILLDLGVINRHLGEVIHDVTHREPVMRANRFLTNRRVMRTVDETLGREVREQFRPWLQHIANSWAAERAGNEGIGKFMQRLRANTTVVGMGWRFSTMMTQLAGYSNSFEYVGVKHVVPAIARFWSNPVAATRFVIERSDEVRHRMDTLDRDIRAALVDLSQPELTKRARKTLTAAKEFAFHGIGYMDRAVSVPTWIGAYNKALEQGMSEADARYAGDKAVRLSQGAAGPKDLAAVQRGRGAWGEALKLMTMFYSYMSAFYQRQRRLGRDVRRASPKDLPNLMARAWWLLVVPPLLAELLSGRGPGEDDDAAWWAFRKMLAQSVGPIPLVRDIFEPAWDKATDNPSFGYRFTPAQGVGEAAVRVAGDVGNIVEGEETKRATRNTLELVGYTTGLVPGQIAAATQFLVDVGQDDADPQTAGEWFTGLTKGKLPEE